MNASLGTIRSELLRGLSLSKQGSYGRRRPAREALPYLEKSRTDLQQWLQELPYDVEALRLLALAEESLLNYTAAELHLSKAIELSEKRSKKDLKRLASLRKASEEWRSLLLTPQQLQRLGVYLRQRGAEQEEQGRTLEGTLDWLRMDSVEDLNAVVHALHRCGAYTDFQVLVNVVGN